MNFPLFPTLTSKGWSNFKRPTASTLVSPHASGDEVRATNQAYPIYEFELTYPEALRDNPTAESDLKTLMGFVLQCRGRLNVFRYLDPNDCAVQGQALGVGDGTTTVFPFVRSLGGWVEPVSYVELLVGVHVAGVTATGGYTVADSVTGHNLLVFNAPPAAGAAITADFSYSFLCRFVDDQKEFENHQKNMWAMKSLKFKSVKRP